MPTKPSVAALVWASDAAYTTGPPVLVTTATKITPPAGEIDEGWKADQKPPAQWSNYVLNVVTSLTDWVRLGTNAADLDAHVIETDGSGYAKIARAELGGTADASSALSVTSNAAGAAASFTDTVGSNAAVATASGVSAAFRAVHTGSGGAIEAVLVGGTGSAIDADAGASGSQAINADGGTTGIGVNALGGSGSGSAVKAESQSASPAVWAVGANVAGSEAVQGQAVHVDATGVLGQTAAAATASARAVFGQALADGLGGEFTSADGYAVKAVASGTVKSSLHCGPQGGALSAVAEGDIMVRSDDNTLEAAVGGAAMRVVHTSGAGYCHGQARDAVGIHNSASFAEFVAETLSSPREPKKAGVVMLTVSGQFRNAGSALNTFNIRLIDKTGGPTTIVTWDFDLLLTNAIAVANIAGNHELALCLRIPYTLPGTGTREFSVEIATQTGGGTGVEWIDLVLEVTGVHNA